MAGPAAGEKPKPSLKIIYLTVFLDFFANGVVLPVLQNHARGLGAKGFDVGLVFTAYSAAQIPGSFLFGALSDSIGRRPVILFSLLMSTVTLLMTMAAPDLDSLIMARAVAGFFSETSVCQAYIADKTTREQRSAALGHMGAFIGLGFMVGPATGAMLGIFGGFQLASGFTAVVTALNLVYALGKLDESLGYETGEKIAVKERSIGSFFAVVLRPMVLLILLGQFALTVSFMGWDTTFGLWAKDVLGYSQKHTGWAFSLLALGFFLASWKTRMFAKHPLNSSKGGLVGCGMMAGGLAAHQLIGGTWSLLLPIFAIGFGYALSEIVFQTLVSVHSPKEMQGAVLGTLESSKNFGRAIAPVLTGYLFDMSPDDINKPYTMLAGLPAFAGLITVLAYAAMPAFQTLTVTKKAGQPLGMILKSGSVGGQDKDSPFDKSGGDDYYGLLIMKVNGTSVKTPEQLKELTDPATEVKIEFAAADDDAKKRN